jgi:hypothetical protein
MNSISESDYSPDDVAIRRALAMTQTHEPAIDIARAALLIAERRRAASRHRDAALQRVHRLWLGLKSAAIFMVVLIIGVLLWMIQAVHTSATGNTASTATTTGYSAASSGGSMSAWTVTLEWLLLLAGLAIAWLIVAGIFRALSDENYGHALA